MSKDVIHDFCIPNMRVAQDAIPGSIIPLWFIPVKTGTYEIVCAQLCGANHSKMAAKMFVTSQTEYDGWFKEATDLQHPKKAAAAPAAAPAAAAK